MPKLIVLQGLPGSGKTTWARDYVKGRKDYVIVNRDSLRNMRGDYWISEQENLITEIEDMCIELSLRKGYNVIVDATNFRGLNRFRDITARFIDPIDVELKIFTTSLEECILRDSKRESPVGESVIKNMYEKYLKQPV